MFRQDPARPSLKTLRKQLHAAEARRQQIIAAAMQDGQLYRHEYPDTAELEDLNLQVDWLHEAMADAVADLRVSVWSGDTALQQRRAREIARLRDDSAPRAGLVGRVMARLGGGLRSPGDTVQA